MIKYIRILTSWMLCLLIFVIAGCSQNDDLTQIEEVAGKRIRRAAFLCREGVYNSELMAPYDIFQHSVFRDSMDFIQPFIVTPDGKPFRTFEGIQITPDYAFENVPDFEILVIPSTATSMGTDLKDEIYMSWVRMAVETAAHVITVCDGAFPLAATGALNGRVATTFPGDRDTFADMFPAVDVKYDVNFVVDGKFITSVGGALSYEPALFLLQQLYSVEHARCTAQGLVLTWNLEHIPYFIAK